MGFARLFWPAIAFFYCCFVAPHCCRAIMSALASRAEGGDCLQQEARVHEKNRNLFTPWPALLQNSTSSIHPVDGHSHRRRMKCSGRQFGALQQMSL